MTDADESKKNGCEERIAEQLLKISSGRNEYKRLEEDTATMAEKCYEQEIDNLRKQSKSVNLFLTCAVSLSAGFTVALLVSEKLARGELRNCLVCLAASVLGSSTSALISALDRHAHGWALHGVKIPPGEGERFNEKMVPFFKARPFLGLLTGMLVFSAMHAHLLVREEPCRLPEDASTVLSRMVFYSLLAGLFAKSLIEKLKALFDQIFG